VTTHQDLANQAAKAANLLAKAGINTTSFTASDDTSIKGWMACPLATTSREQRRRIVVLSEQGNLHLLTETPSVTTIGEIPPAKAAQITNQSFVALKMQIDSLLADIEPYEPPA